MKIKNTSKQPVTINLDGANVRVMPRQTIEVRDKAVEKNAQVNNLRVAGILKVTR